MIKTPKNILFIALFSLVVLGGWVMPALAEGSFKVAPVVIDEKAKARDILKKSVTITNTATHKLTIYPTVANVNPQDGQQEFKPAIGADDLSASLANWIEISRGVIELEPGEEKIIPFIIRVNLNAVPGNYHARISFAAGTNRNQAESGKEKAFVTVNLEVLEDVKERMQLGKFITDRIFFSGDDVLFRYELENIGNKELAPEGDIRVYNSKGEEVAVLDANREGKSFAPDRLELFASAWSAASGLGRYKALLNLRYGANQQGMVQDTVFFWIIPWKLLTIFFGASLAITVFSAFFFHRWLEKRKFSPVMAASGKGYQMDAVSDIGSLSHYLPGFNVHRPASGRVGNKPAAKPIAEKDRSDEIKHQTVSDKSGRQTVSDEVGPKKRWFHFLRRAESKKVVEDKAGNRGAEITRIPQIMPAEAVSAGSPLVLKKSRENAAETISGNVYQSASLQSPTDVRAENFSGAAVLNLKKNEQNEQVTSDSGHRLDLRKRG